MTRLLGALFAGMLAFNPSLARADDSDSKPVPKMEMQEAKAAHEAAQAKLRRLLR